MQGTREHVKDEITEDAATMKKGTRCYKYRNNEQELIKHFLKRYLKF